MTPLQQTLLSEFREKYEEMFNAAVIEILRFLKGEVTEKERDKVLSKLTEQGTALFLNALERVEEAVNAKNEVFESIKKVNYELGGKAERLRIASLPEMEEEEEFTRGSVVLPKNEAIARNALRRELKKKIGV